MQKILNIPFHKFTLQEILEKVKKTIDSRSKLHIITLNTEMIMATQRDAEFARVIENAKLVVPDSIGLQIAYQSSQSKLPKFAREIVASLQTVTGIGLKEPLEIVPGVDLALFLAGMGEEFGYKLFLLGGQEGIAEEASSHLKKLFPKLKVSFYGGGDFSDEKMILEKVNYYAPDILLVALGHPRQEKWLADHMEALQTKIGMGVGGTFDFWAGKTRRAPELLRKIGLEWMYRLITQPSRAQRQLELPKFLWKLTKEKSR